MVQQSDQLRSPPPRAEWEITMRSFGVQPDVDASCRRRKVSPSHATATREQVGRRAAQYGDIVDIMGRRRFPASASRDEAGAVLRGDPVASAASSPAPPSRERSCEDVLPYGSPTYDLPTGRKARAYFDHSIRAGQYAELLGRPGQEKAQLADEIEDSDTAGMDPRVRRVMQALMPTKSRNPRVNHEAVEKIWAEVEAMVAPHGQTGRRRKQPGQQPAPRSPALPDRGVAPRPAMQEVVPAMPAMPFIETRQRRSEVLPAVPSMPCPNRSEEIARIIEDGLAAQAAQLAEQPAGSDAWPLEPEAEQHEEQEAAVRPLESSPRTEEVVNAFLASSRTMHPAVFEQEEEVPADQQAAEAQAELVAFQKGASVEAHPPVDELAATTESMPTLLSRFRRASEAASPGKAGSAAGSPGKSEKEWGAAPDPLDVAQ